MKTTRARLALSWKYPASQKNVEKLCAAAAQNLDQISLDGQDRFAIELLLREALNNAVLHGCRQNPGLSFACQLSISEQSGIIEVSDDGPGFDWRSQPQISLDETSESGRGLHIYARYATAIKYNDAGNCVSLTRIFRASEEHHHQGEQDD